MKTMVKVLGAAFITLQSSFFVSCSDMLEASSELVEYESENTLNHVNDSVYSSLGVIYRMQKIADRVVLLGELRGDLVEATKDASGDLQRLLAFDFSQPNKYNVVSDYYAVINNCNYIIAHLDTTMVRRGRQIFKPEYAAVKAWRAWSYLQLAQAYGKVPLVLDPVMTEKEARVAMQQPLVDMTTICNTFIPDLAPFVGTELPNFGTINGSKSEVFFIPVRVLLGDLCLWAGKYEDAARYYHDFLTDVKDPQILLDNSSYWTSSSVFSTPARGYTINGGRETITLIPMETSTYDGVKGEIYNLFNSTEDNKYYYQLCPSQALRDTSAAQRYCIKQTINNKPDTMYVPSSGFTRAEYAGDLRLCSYYSSSNIGQETEFTEYSMQRQTIQKFFNNVQLTYRLPMVYLRYAEALNRAGYPQSAMLILKRGICEDNIKQYVDSVESKKAGSLIAFDKLFFPQASALGIHSRGCGDVDADKKYDVPQPATALATRQDTVDYQIPLVEDMIITEMALEGAFEGNRFSDLMRVAMRRNDPAYLADKVAGRSGTIDAALRSKLMNTDNWFLPLP